MMGIQRLSKIPSQWLVDIVEILMLLSTEVQSREPRLAYNPHRLKTDVSSRYLNVTYARHSVTAATTDPPHNPIPPAQERALGGTSQ